MRCPKPYLDVNIHDTQHNTKRFLKNKIALELEILIKTQCDKVSVSVLTKVSSLRNIIVKRLIQRGYLLNIGVR